jgi:hypothetical protein
MKDKPQGKKRTHKLPKGYGRAIATATGYSLAFVYQVSQQRTKNRDVERLLELAFAGDKLAFAKAVEECKRGTEILSQL